MFHVSALLLSSCHTPESPPAHSVGLLNQKKADCANSSTIKLDEGNETVGKLSTVQVAQQKLSFTVEATGQLQANANAVTRITAPLAGKITSVSASLGELVKPGQVLATLSSQEIGSLITDLFKAENEIESDLSRDFMEIDCELKQARAELELCEKQYKRAKLLLEEKINSASEVESIQTQVEKHKITIAALEEKKTRVEKIAARKKQLSRVGFEQKASFARNASQHYRSSQQNPHGC